MNSLINLKSMLVIKKLIELRKCKIKCCGDSMLPNYQSGMMIEIKPIDEEIKLGDIVLYMDKKESDYLMILHRVHYIEENIVILKGDNNFDFDIPITKDAVLGKVESDNYGLLDTNRAKNFWMKIRGEWLHE